MMREIVEKLQKNGVEMDFYSYHHYEAGATQNLVMKKHYDVARLSGVEKIRHILKLHGEMLSDFGLPKRKVFLNELGRAKTTGIDGDCLYNAAGLITYLLAFGCSDEPEIYPFPWCTFHNPNLQISFTQYVLREDGSYAATPNGIAMEMLHSMQGRRMECCVSEMDYRDSRYCAIAVKNKEEYAVLCTNPTTESLPCFIALEGVEDGKYQVQIYRCDIQENNCVFKNGKGDGTLRCSMEKEVYAKGGVLKIMELYDKNCFSLLRFRKI